MLHRTAREGHSCPEGRGGQGRAAGPSWPQPAGRKEPLSARAISRPRRGSWRTRPGLCKAAGSYRAASPPLSMMGRLDAPSWPEALLRASCGQADGRGPPAERRGSPGMGRRRPLQARGPRVAAVSALLCFWTLLCVTSGEADASLGPAQSGRAPVAHLQLQPRLKTLSWHSGSPARGMACRMDAPQSPSVRTAARALDNDTHFCSFPNAVLHRGANFTVYAVGANATFQETLSFRNAGRPGAGAANLSCVIYDVHSMNCSWEPGPAAPRDTCYQLFFWFKPKDTEAECAHYLMDPTWMRVGCHFAQLPGEPKTSDNYFFLVNGSSGEAEIPFLDALPFVPYLNEKYSPPANVSARADGPGFEVLWDNPARRFAQSPSSLCYELEVRRQDGAPEGKPVFQRGRDRNTHRLPAGSAGSSVRLRVRHLRGSLWSEWGPAVRLGLDRDRDRDREDRKLALARALAALAGVVVGSAVLAAVCRRSSLQRWLLPPIPQVKEELKDTFVWEQVTGKEATLAADYPEPKDILLVEDLQ